MAEHSVDPSPFPISCWTLITCQWHHKDNTNLALSPGLPIFFNVHERKRGSLGSNITWQMLAWRHEREAVNNRRFRIGPPTSVYQTQLFEAFKDPTTLAWRLWYHTCIFHWRWTGAMACPHTIFTIHHPSYPSIWGLHHSRDVESQAPPISLVWRRG